MRPDRHWEAEYQDADGCVVFFPVIAPGVREAREAADKQAPGMKFVRLHMGGRVREQREVAA